MHKIEHYNTIKCSMAFRVNPEEHYTVAVFLDFL